ncbi:hypothetical protein GGR56DRAFT_231012 [Xylariaceae sp. FL0804]|nr:hypothetical protein GGR56DRAFT_231012 [Xylariaceae sp. FL0804]
MPVGGLRASLDGWHTRMHMCEGLSVGRVVGSTYTLQPTALLRRGAVTLVGALDEPYKLHNSVPLWPKRLQNWPSRRARLARMVCVVGCNIAQHSQPASRVLARHGPSIGPRATVHGMQGTAQGRRRADDHVPASKTPPSPRPNRPAAPVSPERREIIRLASDPREARREDARNMRDLASGTQSRVRSTHSIDGRGWDAPRPYHARRGAQPGGLWHGALCVRRHGDDDGFSPLAPLAKNKRPARYDEAARSLQNLQPSALWILMLPLQCSGFGVCGRGTIEIPKSPVAHVFWLIMPGTRKNIVLCVCVSD